MLRFALVLTAAAAACGDAERDTHDADTDDSTGDADVDTDGTPIDSAPADPGVFDPAVTDVAIEIDYETGNEPYTGPILGFGDTFDTTVTNIDRLFGMRKQLAIPTTLAAMEDIGAIADEELTVSDILTIAQANREQTDTATTKTYYVVFLSGVYADASGPRPTVLGVSIGTTGVLAMFKDTIRSTNVIGFPNVVRYVEQSTLVHELGHAIGLVNNGVPMASPHQDTPHGAHCTNDACVMYYLNEGAREATTFAMTYVLTGNTILFDAACLADADALGGGPP